MNDERDKAMARKGRIIAAVIAGAGLLTVFAPWIVQSLGLAIRYEMLIYLGVIAAFIWAIVNIYQLWRLRQDAQR